jgi:Fe2+ transport system protein FeoA
MTLLDMKKNQVAQIKGFLESSELQSRLVEMGILPGTEIRMIKRTPFNGPLEFKVRDYYVSVRKNDAAHIEIYS